MRILSKQACPQAWLWVLHCVSDRHTAHNPCKAQVDLRALSIPKEDSETKSPDSRAFLKNTPQKGWCRVTNLSYPVLR